MYLWMSWNSCYIFMSLLSHDVLDLKLMDREGVGHLWVVQPDHYSEITDWERLCSQWPLRRNISVCVRPDEERHRDDSLLCGLVEGVVIYVLWTQKLEIKWHVIIHQSDSLFIYNGRISNATYMQSFCIMIANLFFYFTDIVHVTKHQSATSY